MSKELIVSTGRHETRVAILEDDQVVELFYEREKEYSLAGSIHKGRVTRVLPGMQSAFVDIGLERDAFLYVSDFFEDNDEYDAVVSTVEEKVLKMEGKQQTPALEKPLARQAAAAESVVPEPVPQADGSAEGPAAAAVPSGQPPRQDRGDRGERGGDRGGRPDRGRRGRRRRGGRGGSSSGLPESKFFSPRPETSHAQPAEAAADAGTEESDDLLILPGESLAKYTGPEETEESDATAEEVIAEAVEAAAAEAAEIEIAEAPAQTFEPEPVATAPVPKPAPFWKIEPEPEPEPEPVAAAPETKPAPIKEPEPEPEPEIEPPTPEPSPVEAMGSEGEGEGLSAAEVAEDETAEEIAARPEEESDMAENAQPEDGAIPAEEGPEPARIPTSLTAQLREQGHRYPHRVSRRMRRKMRGGREDQPPAGGAPQGEAKSVTAPAEPPSEERMPQERSSQERSSQDRNSQERSSQERGPRERSERERPERERPPLPSISDLLKEGQEIVVQIAKEPLGQKGARITSHIALPGRFVVYMPTVEHVGVSRKIPSDEERQRLKRVLQTHRQGVPGGFICRTAAENKSEEELRQDMHFLYNLWLDMRQKAEKKPAPVLLHHDLDLVQRILRDQLTTSFKTIWVDNEELYESILQFVERFQPGLVGRVKLYTRTNPIFDEFGITAEVEKALRPKVWLKSGGYIVINQTEALVAIDINTGKYVGKSNRLEDTIVKINSDAIKEIVRQIRLRDLGGIIVVDFIDMDERRNRMKVMAALEDGMRADRAPYKILQFNDFGLVAITRKRVKQSLERTLCSPCPSCEGAGYIKSVQTVITEILTEAQRMQKALATETGNLMLRVNPEVARVLKSNQNSFLQEIEEIAGRTVLVKSDPLLHQTKFDLA